MAWPAKSSLLNLLAYKALETYSFITSTHQGLNMSSQTEIETSVGDNAENKAQALLETLKQMHPKIRWSLYPLGDYDQYAEVDAPDVLVSFGSKTQQMDEGLVDAYSTMMGEACEPKVWGISVEAAQLIQNHNRVFMAKYPNADGPRQHIKAK